VVRVAGVEPVPRGAVGSRLDVADGHRLRRRDASPVRWCADLQLARQREDAHARPHRADCPAPLDHAGGGAPLRSEADEVWPADPQLKGGSEATVRISTADLIPTESNLLPSYTSFSELRVACDEFCQRVNAHPHSATRQAPIERLAQERERLHAPPAHPIPLRSVSRTASARTSRWSNSKVASTRSGRLRALATDRARSAARRSSSLRATTSLSAPPQPRPVPPL
jgi:hypothetical protein